MHVTKLRHSSIVSVLTTPADILNIEVDKRSIRPADAEEQRSAYNDNWFDKLAIDYLSQNVQAASGLRNSKSGFKSLVDAASAASRNFSPEKQREIVIQALQSAFPRPILSLIKALLPESKFAREYFAAFTTIFFVWLVGPCEVRESEFNGSKEKNVVHIPKCRFLEETKCVGMCINMCKMPSQSFIKDSLGMPVNMVPNFDDMSCQMIFGEEPPELLNDPALKQPCFKLCKVKQRHTNCSS